jgi:hypothetical protein
LQQQAIGILGVNLVYGVVRQRSDIEALLAGLFDELSIERIEIDVIEFSGSAFAGQDAHAGCLALLRRRMSHAIVFDSQGKIVEPASVLRKRPLLVMRGRFSRFDLFDPGLFQAANQQLLSEGTPFERKPAALLEMTIHPVGGDETLAEPEMLPRIQQLSRYGSVMVTDYPETYLLSRYLQRYSSEPVRFIMGVAAAAKTVHEVFYQSLPGTLLEGLGRLFAPNVKLYVAPMPREAFNAALGDLSGSLKVEESGKSLVTLDDLMVSLPGVHLYEYLRASGRVVALQQAP